MLQFLINSPKPGAINAALFIPFPFKRPSLDQQEWKTPKNKKLLGEKE